MGEFDMSVALVSLARAARSVCRAPLPAAFCCSCIYALRILAALRNPAPLYGFWACMCACAGVCGLVRSIAYTQEGDLSFGNAYTYLHIYAFIVRKSAWVYANSHKLPFE